jgi:hypothetical protein
LRCHLQTNAILRIILFLDAHFPRLPEDDLTCPTFDPILESLVNYSLQKLMRELGSLHADS